MPRIKEAIFLLGQMMNRGNVLLAASVQRANDDNASRASRGFLPVFVAICLLILCSSSPALARTISVGLSMGQSAISVKSSAAITAVDGGGKKYALGNQADFKVTGKGVVSTGKHSLKLPVTLTSGKPLSFNGRRYRGSFRLIVSGSGATLLNLLELEDYLRGVLKMEVNPLWSMEALKAQAVVSRTYALRSIQNNHGKGGYDLCDSISSQVYRGINAEDPRTDQAIQATRGMVLKFGNGVAFTPFHSYSGGATADVSTVWGGDVPYLKGVKEDFNTDSPNKAWEARLTAAQVEAALRSAGVNVGSLQELRVEKTDSYGRAILLRAIGTGGSQTLKSHSFRMAAGSNVIKSTVLTISAPTGSQITAVERAPAPVQPATPLSRPVALADVPTSLTPLSAAEETRLTELTAQGAFNAEELMDMLMNPDKRKGYLVRALRTRIPEVPSIPVPQPVSPVRGQFVFRGTGWGHGVGMSQWGAKALADQGYDFKKILSFYYPGTRLDGM